MNTSLLLGQVVTGLATGAGYAVVAVGLTYTLGLARIMNFAFGTFYMLAAFAVATTMNLFGLPYAGAALLALLLAAPVGWLFSRIIVLPALRISDPAVMIATLGVGVVLTNVAQLFFGSQVTFIASPFADVVYRFGSATVSLQSIILFIAAPLVTLGIAVFMSSTTTGRRIRGAAESPALAAATGMNVPAIQVLAVTIGIALAVVAAVLAAPVNVISVFMGDEVLLKAFAVATLAGIGRIWGAFGLGLGVGVFEALVSGYLSTAYSTAAIYGLLIFTLIFFPKGLFSGH